MHHCAFPRSLAASQSPAPLLAAGNSRASWQCGNALVLASHSDEHLGWRAQVAAALHQGPNELAPLGEAYRCVALLQLGDLAQVCACLSHLGVEVEVCETGGA
jgi:hypothetical protein